MLLTRSLSRRWILLPHSVLQHNHPHRHRLQLAGISLACLLASGVAAPASAADYFNGKSLYETHCALCHGVDGKPVMPGAPRFERGERLMQPDAALFESIRNGKNAMPAFQGLLRNEEILDLVAFIKTFL